MQLFSKTVSFRAAHVRGGRMKENRYSLYRSAPGFGLRIESPDGVAVEFPWIAHDRKTAVILLRPLRGAGVDPVHFGDVVRDFITEQYLKQLEYNRLALPAAVI